MNIRLLRSPVTELLLAIALGFASTAPVQARVNLTPEFSAATVRPRMLALLPPHADLIQQKVIVSQQMVAETKEIEDLATTQLRRELEERGYGVRLLAVDEINADPELAELVRRFDARYEEEWAKILARPRKVKARRYSCGDEARALAARLGVDGLAVARVQLVAAGGGRIALAVLLGFGSYGFGRLDTAFLDGATGDVEAYADAIKSPLGIKEIQERSAGLVTTLAEQALRKFPEADQVLKVKAKDLEAARQDDEEVEGDDAAVLSELEVLLDPQSEAKGTAPAPSEARDGPAEETAAEPVIEPEAD
jgi:hypothetical protein